MRILKARLADLAREQQAEKIENLRGERRSVDFGSQIRSYVLAPYQMVKDHRTGVEIGDPERVLDGDIDRFIEAELRRRARRASRSKRRRRRRTRPGHSRTAAADARGSAPRCRRAGSPPT